VLELTYPEYIQVLEEKIMKRFTVVLVLCGLTVALGAGLKGIPQNLTGFEKWTQVAKNLDTGGPHSGQSKIVFANKLAADAWKKKGALPVGSIVVKTSGKVSSPAFVAVMTKRAGGWYYEEYFPKKGVYSVGAGGPGGQALCKDCHAGVADQDYLFTRP
jgi:Cytochrome P460